MWIKTFSVTCGKTGERDTSNDVMLSSSLGNTRWRDVLRGSRSVRGRLFPEDRDVSETPQPLCNVLITLVLSSGQGRKERRKGGRKERRKGERKESKREGERKVAKKEGGRGMEERKEGRESRKG